MPVDTTRYQEVVAAFEKKYPGDIRSARDIEAIRRVTWGSPMLDWISKGGCPLGRYVRVYGAFSTAKSLTALELAKEFQRAGLVVYWYDVEKQFVADFALERGVDTEELKIIEGDTIEEIGVKLEALLSIAHLHVIDSVSEASSLDTLKAPVSAWRPGIEARAWKKVMYKVHHAFDRADNTIVLVDQIRDKIGQGKGTKAAGGRLFEHKSSLSIEFRRGDWLFYNKQGFLEPGSDEEGRSSTLTRGMDGRVEPDGVELLARCEKSRIGRPLQTATLYYDLNTKLFDRTFEFAAAAKYFGLVERSGSWYTYKPPRGKPIKIQGEMGLRKLVTEQEELVDAIWERCRAQD